MRCSIVMAMHCYSRYRSRLSPHAVFNAGGAVSVITALRKNRRVERCNLHNERVAMELDAVTAQTSDRRPAPRVWIARVQLGDASNTAARCMRLPIACRLCVGAATSVACEGDGARFAIDCAAFGAADKRSPLSGEPSPLLRSRGVCVLPIDAGQLLRAAGGQRRRLFPFPSAGRRTQPPTRPRCGHVGALLSRSRPRACRCGRHLAAHGPGPR